MRIDEQVEPYPNTERTVRTVCALVKVTAVEFLEGEELGTMNLKICL